MIWLWIVLGIVASVPLAVALFLFGLWIYLRVYYAQYLERIFQEKPLFIIPRGQPVEGAEDVSFTSADGLRLRGCYLRTTAGRRRGVILFGLEFGSNRWSCVPYCQQLIDCGYDVFAFEPRNQGDSEAEPGYEPLQWLSDRDVRDMEAALKYLKSRPDADPDGIGFFGVSKGGGAGLLVAAHDPYVRCFVTDGIFSTFATMVPYMRKWIAIYSKQYWLQAILPSWFYGIIARTCVGRLQKRLGVRFLNLEPILPKLAARPLLMIHGGADTYIKPEMARALFKKSRQPKEFWLVEGARHNQAIQVAGDAYHQRVLGFFHRSFPRPARNAEPVKTGKKSLVAS